MSSDDGYILRVNGAGKYVLQHYSASVDDYPPIDDPKALVFDTLEAAMHAYDTLDGMEVDYQSEYGLTTHLNLPHTNPPLEEEHKVNSEKYVRKSFTVDAVQITESNMEEVAAWCQGDILTTDQGAKFIRVRVHNPMTERQTRGFAGDWVLYAGKGYKVYPDKAFRNSFDGPLEDTRNVFANRQTSQVS